MNVVLSWLPLVVFCSVILYLLFTEFQNTVDEYFVRIILKACLMLIIATGISQVLSLLIIFCWKYAIPFSSVLSLREIFYFVCAFPVVEVGIFSIGIFFTRPLFNDWILILSILMVFVSMEYWISFSKGSLRKLHAFAHFHQVSSIRTLQVLSPFYFSAVVDLFFIHLKNYLMPLVFVLVVMDFKIILPRLVEAGLTYQSFVLFMSLIMSLHLLSYKKGART